MQNTYMYMYCTHVPSFLASWSTVFPPYMQVYMYIDLALYNIVVLCVYHTEHCKCIELLNTMYSSEGMYSLLKVGTYS